MRIGLTDFRAFADTGMIEIKPLTFLVGENSSGKSSFLSALNYVWRFQERLQNASFSSPPFDLGTFDEIVHRVRGRRRPDCFSVAVDNDVAFDPRSPFQPRPRNTETLRGNAVLRLNFVNSAGESALSGLSFTFAEYHLLMSFGNDVSVKIFSSGAEVFDSERGEERLPFEGSALSPRVDISLIDFFLRRLLVSRTSTTTKSESPETQAISIVWAALNALTKTFPRAIFASAPVRSNPSRVYTPVDQGRSPEGRHTPQVLFKIKETDKNRWLRLKAGLDEFGVMSGMYSKIDVTRYRSSGSSPFQISITQKGKQSNIMDVGYGVSQALPILADLIEGPPKSGFLFQQPEVHLHPQAQAALGSYFANYVSTHRGSYIIAETHSDYMIDRVRSYIRDNSLKASDATIIYFEGKGTDVVLHQISVDETGNVKNTPNGYRDFFINEQLRTLGVEDDYVSDY